MPIEMIILTFALGAISGMSSVIVFQEIAFRKKIKSSVSGYKKSRDGQAPLSVDLSNNIITQSAANNEDRVPGRQSDAKYVQYRIQ